MNTHTPGPLIAIPCAPYGDYTRIVVTKDRGALGYSPKASDDPLGYTRYTPEDAALLAASYTMVDKAARSFKVEATELAACDLSAFVEIVLGHAGIAICYPERYSPEYRATLLRAVGPLLPEYSRQRLAMP